MTDRLAPQSGLSLILEEDRHFAGYEGAQELVDKARFLLAHPEVALRIGAAGAAHFAAQLAPARQQQRLLDWVLTGRLDSLHGTAWDGRPALAEREGVALERRIALYEMLQEAHRLQPRLRVLFGSGVPACYIADAADLHRAELAVLRTGAAEPPARALARACAAGKPIACPDLESARREGWDFVVARSGGAPPELAGARLLRV